MKRRNLGLGMMIGNAIAVAILVSSGSCNAGTWVSTVIFQMLGLYLASTVGK